MHRNIEVAIACVALACCTSTAAKGKAQKGPFYAGATVEIVPIDAALQPSGATATVKTTDDEGSFVVPSSVTSRLVEVTAVGFYWDELHSIDADATVKLSALVDLATERNFRVNVLTTMETNRIRVLVVSGLSFSDARLQAETELRDALSLEDGAEGTFDTYDLTTDTQGGQALLQASLLMLAMSDQFRKENVHGAPVTDALSTIAANFADGTIDGTVAAMVDDARAFLGLPRPTGSGEFSFAAVTNAKKGVPYTSNEITAYFPTEVQADGCDANFSPLLSMGQLRR